jgi:hypothetical protein
MTICTIPEPTELTYLYSTDAAQIGQSATVEPRNGRSVNVTVPAAGFVVFE